VRRAANRARNAESVALKEARDQEKKARDQEKKAKEQEKKALVAQEAAKRERDAARRNAYLAHMTLAQRAWDDSYIGLVLELLEDERPREGQTDLRGFEWFYLNRLCHSELRTLAVHGGEVRGVAFSPHGRRIASASSDVTV
jgi:hypothetical protein